jgi:hypothetical protein
MNLYGRTICRWAGRSAVFIAFTATVVALAGWPGYRHLAADQALVKISLRHTGARLGECRTLSAAELEGLAPNMRAPKQCPRERSPLELEMDLNGHRVVDVTLEAQGLHADGRAVFYRRLQVPAGTVAVAVRMKDDVRQSSFSYHDTHQTHLEPGDALIVDFDDATGSFVFL